MDDGYVGEIRCFAGDFAPEGWLYCNGKELLIRDFPALYSILGTTYGGDGINAFKLPDLSGRMIMSAGTGDKLSNRQLGELGGEESVLLDISQIPEHAHDATFYIGTVYTVERQVAINSLMEVNNASGNESGPSGNYLAADNSFSGNYSPNTDRTALNENAISIDSIDLQVDAIDINKQPKVVLGLTGNDEAHDNMVPFIALNWIICVEPPYYPARS
ncbi:phage tail protein [Gracilimonas mengyeensis]|uniref:Microcystin-dependent protein n=1 Tax=Gracilimonas mengyeensis TaxID=1302730 RepID=A0A521AUD9_9BACT|nr:tail fiber protein [Gracilimonas mengyeensis]SMO38436.1 Microcystin-dependent protein [Gracilimonas mengyeensis]